MEGKLIIGSFFLTLLLPSSTSSPSPAPDPAPGPAPVVIGVTIPAMAIGPALAMLGPLAPGLIGAGIGAGVTGLGATALAKVAKTSLIGGLIGSRLLPPKQSTTTKKP